LRRNEKSFFDFFNLKGHSFKEETCVSTFPLPLNEKEQLKRKRKRMVKCFLTESRGKATIAPFLRRKAVLFSLS